VGDVVFVEGAPGTGKSTTAQFLARQLAYHGRPARWIYEEEVPNPFLPEMPPDGFRTWDDYGNAHVVQWQAFARVAAAARETIVVESALLQRPVFTMLRRDVEPVLIEGVVNRFAGAVAPLNPRLVYLAHPDPEGAWRAVMAKRGATVIADAVRHSEDWPYMQSRGLVSLDGLLAYWRAHAALCDSIVSWLPMTTHVVDAASGTWAERRRHVGGLLGVPAEEPPAPDARELLSLVGRYHDGERAITIALEGDDLVLRGVLWASNRLLPLAPRAFDVEAWPLRVRFEPAADGPPRELHWEGPRLWWGGPLGVYTRTGA
jgi:KaiC/GvpD/RAD55 family RecA-like ATPase